MTTKQENTTKEVVSEEKSTSSKAKSRKRLNLDLTPEAYTLLQRLADESGKSMTEVLRSGLALYGIAQDESHKGRSMAVIDDGEKIVKQIIGPI